MEIAQKWQCCDQVGYGLVNRNFFYSTWDKRKNKRNRLRREWEPNTRNDNETTS